MANSNQQVRQVNLGRRVGGTVVLLIAQLSKSLLWVLSGFALISFSIVYMALMEVAIVFLLLNRWKMSWVILIVTCASEMVVSSILAILIFSQLSAHALYELHLMAALGFSMIFMVSLFELIAALTKEVRVHYLGGQPPPFKPTYTGPPPEPEF